MHFKVFYTNYKNLIVIQHNNFTVFHSWITFENDGKSYTAGMSPMSNYWEIPSEDWVSGKNESERNTKVSVIFQGFYFTWPHSKWRPSIKSDWVDGL